MSKLLLAIVIVLSASWAYGARKTGHWRWIGANGGLALAAVAGWSLAPAWAGYAVGAAWGLLIGLPLLAARRVGALQAGGGQARAWSWQGLAAWMYPPAQRAEAAAMADVGAAVGARRLDEALARLEPHKDTGWGRAMGFYLRGEWRELRDCCAALLLEHPEDPFLLTGHLRALAELGAVGDLLREADRRWPALEALGPAYRELVFLLVFAFTGQPDQLRRLSASGQTQTEPATYAYWLATAEYVAGNPLGADDRLRSIADDGDALWQARIQRRIDQPPAAHPRLSPESQALLERFRERWMRVPPA